MVSLTKTRPGTPDLLRNGFTYVDLPNVEMMSEREILPVPAGLMVTRPRPTPDRGMGSYTNPHPNVGTPSVLSMLITLMWYEMLNENTAGMLIMAMVLVGMVRPMNSSDLHFAQSTVVALLEIEITWSSNFLRKS
ncbi:hypothetical protein AYL99_11891 [Fonsecaea erecta]|uniref:Uncharacterized protein n=1 Tax=Fonsecaea erecta TaxID=1367422 RepID=A0A178Z255_9EURO|nr:hypothetical protein AYL99_11891 [Fonsecaea erecta]OAP53869.1 hypothetical protein AYL99_11891 [Fonsecaea erecta]